MSRKPCGVTGCDGYLHLGVHFDGAHEWCPDAAQAAKEYNDEREKEIKDRKDNDDSQFWKKGCLQGF